jgi:sugar/nucleoside kinase (ribokinase family)
MGKYLLDDMDRYGIDTSGIKTDPAGTSRSINIMYPDGSRRNFYDGKSHMDLKAPERAFELLETTEIVHFNIPNWARHMLEFAKKRSGAVSCDLQDIRNMNDPYRKDFIENSDLIFFSSSEVGDPKVFLKGFLQKYPDKMFVTGMGKRGSGLGFKGSVQFFAPVSEETFKADPQNEMVKELLSAPVVDTNGAGDSLATGFIYGLFFLGLTPEESILTGQISARRTCSLKGTSDGLITENELLHLLKCAGVKIPCHSA